MDSGTWMASGKSPPAQFDSAQVGGARMTREITRNFSLEDWCTPVRRIGRVDFEGYCHEVDVLKVTYQQKAHVFGRIAGVMGGTYRGTGFVGGGGGFVDTVHDSVATAVVRNRYGQVSTVEIPSDVGAVEGMQLRLDYLNGHMIGVTNQSGGGSVRVVASPSDFVAYRKGARADVMLGLVSLVCLWNGIVQPWPELLLAAAIAAIRPVMTVIEIRDGKRRLAQMTGYMREILSSSAATGVPAH